MVRSRFSDIMWRKNDVSWLSDWIINSFFPWWRGHLPRKQWQDSSGSHWVFQGACDIILYFIYFFTHDLAGTEFSPSPYWESLGCAVEVFIQQSYSSSVHVFTILVKNYAKLDRSLLKRCHDALVLSSKLNMVQYNITLSDFFFSWSCSVLKWFCIWWVFSFPIIIQEHRGAFPFFVQSAKKKKRKEKPIHFTAKFHIWEQNMKASVFCFDYELQSSWSTVAALKCGKEKLRLFTHFFTISALAITRPVPDFYLF